MDPVALRLMVNYPVCGNDTPARSFCAAFGGTSVREFLRKVMGEKLYGAVVKTYYAGRRLSRKFRLGLGNLRSATIFLFQPGLAASFGQRISLLCQFIRISAKVSCPHRMFEILVFVTDILKLGPDHEGVFIEAGCFKGGSSAKFSLAAKLVDRRLIIFDSFQGLPDNEENVGRTTYGERITAFYEGSYMGTLEEVKSNIAKYGAIEMCEFVPGWFDDTMLGFQGTVISAYVDVDLATSTRTCLRYLYPRLVSDGHIVSQDGHLPLVLEALDDDSFWQNVLGVRKPRIEGFGKSTILVIGKEA